MAVGLQPLKAALRLLHSQLSTADTGCHQRASLINALDRNRIMPLWTAVCLQKVLRWYRQLLVVPDQAGKTWID